MILILPRPPLWAEPNEPNYLYISQVSKTKLYLNLLSYSDSHEFSYYFDPPLSQDKKAKHQLHLPSKKESTHLYFFRVFDRGTSIQRWECVCHHGGGSRGGLGHWPSPILPWPVAKTPPAPSPVVAHTLPSLDWGLWGWKSYLYLVYFFPTGLVLKKDVGEHFSKTIIFW